MKIYVILYRKGWINGIMTSLEYIEKVIENMQSILEHTKTMLKPLKNKINDDLKKHYEREKKDVEEQIAHLQQIKTKLEAWEAVEKHLEYFPSDYWNGIPEDVIAMTSNIDRKDYPQVKKALEVKDND